MLTLTSLQEHYDQLKAKDPKIRIRDAAKKLGVSELELLELGLGGDVVRLSGDWKDLLAELHQLDRVMALTRNDFAVHERKGIYHNISFFKGGKMGVAVNEDIDLRFFMTEWKYAYGVRMPKNNRVLHSFQFFNQSGEAIHKIYLTPKSDPLAFQKLLEKYKAKDQKKKLKPKSARKKKSATARLPVQKTRQFQLDWLQLKDTHDFFPLLAKYKLARLLALELAPKGYAYQVSEEAIPTLFNLVATTQLPIMVFVGNSGCIQIHTGPIKKIVSFQNWFNVMDPDFNLHLNLLGVAKIWVVKKPTADGVVTSLEVFDEEGDIIMQCFGKRKPGLPELKEWRNAIEKLSPLHNEV